MILFEKQVLEKLNNYLTECNGDALARIYALCFSVDAKWDDAKDILVITGRGADNERNT